MKSAFFTRTSVLFVVFAVTALQFLSRVADAQVLWSTAGASSAYMTAGNWTGGAVPGTTAWAQFGANGTMTSMLIAMSASNNNGTNNQAVGAIDMTSARTAGALSVGAGAVLGTLTLNGATVSGTGNVILSNSHTSALNFLIGSPVLRIAIPGTANRNVITAPGSSSTVLGSTINITDTITSTAPLTFLGGGTWNGSSGNAGGLFKLGGGQAFTAGITAGNSDGSQVGVVELDAINTMSNTSGNNITVNPFSELYLNAATGTFNTSNITLNLNGSGNPVSLTAPGGALVSKVNTSYTWTGPINLASDAKITTLGSGTLTLTGNISGSGAFIKDGTTAAGTVSLTATSNTWSGGTQVGTGAVVVASGSAISTGSLSMTGLTSGLSSSITFNNTSQTISGLSSSFVPTTGTQTQTVSLSSGHTLTVNQSGNTTFGNGTVATQTSIISGAGSLVKTGAGRLTLTSSGSFLTGGVTITNGEIRFNPATTTAVTMNSPITLNGGKLSTTSAATTAQINLGTLNLAANSTIDLGTATAHNVKFANSGAVSWTGGTTLNVTGWQGAYDGTSATAGKLFIGTTSAGVTSGQLAQIQFTDGSGNVYPAAILSSGEIVPKATITTTVTGYGPFSNATSNAISVAYNSAGPFTGNFRVQLSGPSGTFTADTTTNIIGGPSATTPISATIPSGVAAGAGYRVRVISGSPTAIFGTDNGSNISILAPTPTVTSVSPNAGIPGSSVTITGTNFNTTGSSNIVYFGAVKGTVTSSGSTTSLVVTVPAGATFDHVYVLNNGASLSASERLSFTPTYTTTHLTTGQINFSAHQDFSSGTAPFISIIGDIDGDGKSDMVTANSSGGSLSVFRNTSTAGSITAGSFGSPTTLTTASTPTNVRFADVDNDGKADLVVVNAAAASVSIFRNTSSSGSISFASRADFSTSASALAPIEINVADYDGDGRPDIAVSASFSNSIAVLQNASSPGSVSFGTAVAFAAGTGAFGLTSADFDGDGKVDIAVVDTGAAIVSVLRNTSTTGSINSGSFATAVTFVTGTTPVDIEAADIDGDGKIDIVLSNSNSNSMSVLRNTSSSGSITSGSFATHADFSVGTNPSGVAIGDIDGDSKPDIAVSNSGSNTVSVFRNTSTSGSVSMATAVNFATANGPQGLSIGDLDGDGKPDMAVANVTSNSVSVFRNFRLPNVAAITGTTTVCESATTTLSNATSGGTWSVTNAVNATVSSGAVVTGLVAGADTVEYRVIVSGDTTIVFTPITINPAPNAGSISGTTTLCVGTTTTLSASGSGGGTWTSSTTSRATVDAGGVVTGVSGGAVTITYSVTNSCGTDNATAAVTVTPLPATPAAIGGPTSVGVGATITLTEAVGGGTWSSVTPGVATVNSSGDVTGVSLGTSVISYTISNSCGTNAVTTTVSVGGGTFYSKATGNLNVLSSWGTNTDGTGTAPSSFTSTDQTFYMRNGNAGTLSANWTVSGTNSIVVVEQTDFTITSSFWVNATIDVNAGRTLTIQNSTLPTLGNLSTTSTITYNNGVNNVLQYSGTTYGNIVFSGSGTGVTNPGAAADLTFAGNFTLSSSATFVAANITIVTTGTFNQTITGNGYTFSCYAINNNYSGGKTGTLSLASGTPITVVYLYMNNTGSSNRFIDGGNFIIVNNIYLGGTASGYSISGTFTLVGGIITNNAGTGACVAVLNHVTVNVSGSSSVNFYPASGSASTTIAGDFTVTAMGSGSVNFYDNVINIGGNFTHTPSTLVINFGNSTVNFYGSTSTTYFSNIATTGVVFYNVNITKTTGGTLTFGSGPITINNTFHIVSAPTGSITLGTSYIYLYGDFTHTPSNETFISTGNTFVFAGTNTQTYTSAVTTSGSTFYNIEVNKAGGNIVINNNISIFNNYFITAAPSASIDFGNRVINIGGNFTHTPTSSCIVYGTSTVNFYGASSTTYVSNITTTGSIFYNVTINKSSGGTLTFGTYPITINNNFVITAAPAGSITLGTSYIYLYGNFTHTPTTESFVSTGNTFVFTGTNTQTYSSLVTTTGSNFYRIVVDKSGGTITINNNISIFNNFVVTAAPSSSIFFGSHTVNIGGDFTNTPSVETIDYGTGTVTFTGGTATTYTSSISGTGSSFHSININKTSGGSFTFGSSPITIEGNFTITGASSSSINLGSSYIYLYGNFNHIPSFNTLVSTGNTFVFSGGGTQTYTTGITGTVGNTFNHVEVDKSGGTLTFNNSINISGNFVITAAPVNSIFFGSNTINIALNFTHTPTTLAVNAGTSTVYFYTAGTNVYSCNVSGTGMVFYNVTIDKPGGSFSWGTDNVTINNDLRISASLAGSITLTTGSIFLYGDFIHIPSVETFINTGNTFVFRGAAAQTYTTNITGTTGNTFNNFIINKTGGSLTFNNSITIVGNYTITAAAASSIAFGSNTINIVGDFTHTPTTNTISAGTSTVNFYGGSSTTYVSNVSASAGVIFYNLVINKSSGGTLTFGSDNLTINGDYTIIAADVASITLGTGSIFLLGNFLHTPSTEVFVSTGNTFVFSGTGTQTYTTNITGTTGNTFNNITINKSGGSLTLNNSITIVGNYVITAAPSSSIYFGSNTVNIGGNFTHTPSTLCLNAGTSTMIFYGGTAGVYFTNVSGTGVAVYDLIINKTSGGTFSFGTSPITIGNDFYVQGAPAGSITLGTGSIFLAGNFNHGPATESFISTGNTFVFNGTGSQTYTTAITGVVGSTFNNITINKSAGTLTLNNSITINGHYVVTAAPSLSILFGANTINVGRNFTHTPSTLAIDFGTSTVIFFGGTAGVYSSNIATTGVVFNHITFNKTTGGTFTFGSSPVTVNGNFYVQGAPAGSITLGSGNIYLHGNFNHNPTTESFVNTGNTFIFTGTGTQTYVTNITGTVGTIFNNITINKAGGTLTFNNNITIIGDFIVTAAPASGIIFGNNIIDIGGDFTHTPTTLAINFGTSTVVFNGTAAQVYVCNVTGGNIFYNLIINNSSTGITLNTNISISNTFTLTLGKVNCGSNLVHIMNTGSVSGGSLTSYVNGRLSKDVPSGSVASMFFEVGDNSYAPMRFALSGSGASSGQIVVRSVAGTHPSSSGSFIDVAHFVNRYWSVQYPVTVTPGAFPTNDSFSYSISDITGAASNAGFVVRQYNGSTWSNAGYSVSLASATAPLLGKATVAGNEASAGTSVITDFVIGAPACSATGGTTTATSSHGCPGASTTLSLTGASTGGGTTYQWKSSPTGSSWTTIAGATNATLSTGAISTNTQYHCVVTCIVTGLADTSSDLSYTVDPLPATPAAITGTTSIATLGATTTLADVTSGGTWSSSNTAIATVNASGVVTAVGLGAAIISYTITNSCGSAYDTTLVTISSSNHAPVFTNATGNVITLCQDAVSYQLTENLAAKDYDTAQTLTWSIVTPPSHGTAVIASSRPSNGFIVRPVGTTYVPNAGYAGADTMVLMISDGIVSSTTTFYVHINALPAVPVISGATSVCRGGTATLVGSPAGGIWYAADANSTINSSTGVITGVAGPTTRITYLSPYNAFGCRSQNRATIAILTYPATGTLTGSPAVCPGSSTTISASVTGGTWASSNASIVTISPAGAATGLASGTVTISYTVNNGCFSATVTAPLAVGGATTPSAIGGGTYVCMGSTLTYTNGLSGGTWSSTNTSVANISGSGVITPVAVGNATIVYSYTNGCGITRSVSKNVTVYDLLNTGTISGPSTVLRGGVINLTTTGVSSGAWYVPAASSGIILASGSGTTGSVFGSSVGTANVYYAATNVCGTARSNYTVSVTAGRPVNGGQAVAGTEADDITVFPNPTSGSIFIEIPGSGTSTVMITDMSCKVVITEYSNSGKLEVDLSTLASGTYQVNVNNGDKVFSRKVVLQ